ncbi:alginate O-acetyltransferase AlgX-related protein, partial [Roseinatronobacter sp. NSM]|uniref:alginate O-acetyltransferase AlgX-related protein n=1 Tax=Roseinatronobacter sp. NSM TaxID=3457785 RepID=UPI0040354AD3
MNLRYTCTALLLAAAPASFAAAQDVPLYCDAMADPEAYAGILSNALMPLRIDPESGFVYTNRDFIENYTLPEEAIALLNLINQNVRDNETGLYMIVLPPRVAISTLPDFDRLFPAAPIFDLSAALATFSDSISRLNSSGIVTPNLFQHLIDTPHLKEGYYISGDNHWSPTGAFESIAALATMGVNFSYSSEKNKYQVRDTVSRSTGGSYRKAIAQICGTEIYEDNFSFSRFEINTEGSTVQDQLFGSISSDSNKISLVGTSNSNGGFNDSFLAADALSYHFQTDVENFGVNGGGLVLSIESYFHDKQARESKIALIWETFHTELLNMNRSTLSQIYGAALPACEPGPLTLTDQTTLDDTWKDLTLHGLFLQDVLELSIPDMKTGNISIEAT